MQDLPLSAVVVVFNEEARLPECLKSLMFCDEIIVCDLGSTDGSLEIAYQFASKVVQRSWVPFAEMILPSLFPLARHEWVLRLDPDEVIDPSLVGPIRNAMAEPPSNVCSYRLPSQYFFCGIKLEGTFWGGRRDRAFTIINPQRLKIEPLVHRSFAIPFGMLEERICAPEAAIVHHYWVDSYRQLLEKHRRYIRAEGESRYKSGQRFNALTLLRSVARAGFYALQPRGLRRDGLRGLFLRSFYVWYELRATFSLRAYQARVTRMLNQ